MSKIKLPNGKEATSFVTDDNSELAIVHLSTLKRLIKHLTATNVKDIIETMAERLYFFSKDDNTTLLDYVTALKDEVAFHESVNLIKTYDPNVKEDDGATGDATAGCAIAPNQPSFKWDSNYQWTMVDDSIPNFISRLNGMRAMGWNDFSNVRENGVYSFILWKEIDPVEANQSQTVAPEVMPAHIVPMNENDEKFDWFTYTEDEALQDDNDFNSIIAGYKECGWIEHHSYFHEAVGKVTKMYKLKQD